MKYTLGGHFEFRFETVYDTIFLLMKYGQSPWMSAPYSPHLSDNFQARSFAEGEGLPVTIFQICNEDGKIYEMSVLVLENQFSNLLYGAADTIYQTIPFDLEEHRKVIAAVYHEYETDEELAEDCAEYRRCVID